MTKTKDKMKIKDRVEEFRKFLQELDGGGHGWQIPHGTICDEFESLISQTKKDLLKQMMEECNKTENEAGRLLVKKFQDD